MKRAGVGLILVLAFCGIADSAYILQHNLSGTPLQCDIQSLSGCNLVAASQYAYLFGIPLSEFGVVFYSTLFILAALELALFDQFLRRTLQVLSLVGVIASLYFTILQVFIIKAVCIYCLTSAVLALLIFIFATMIEPLRKQAGTASKPLSMPPL